MGSWDREVETEGVRKIAMPLSWEVQLLKQQMQGTGLVQVE